jgi:DNA-directed RNA polymerase sigma subunit (sigma70/sigma32)
MIGNPHGWTYEEIGAVLGVSPQRVRQIEQRAFEKIRRELKRQFGITAADVKGITSPEGETHEFWA